MAEEIPPGEVHLWTVPLDRPPLPLEWLARQLTADEQARASRFHFARDRCRYVAGRGCLRVLLGRYTGVAPRAVAIRYGPHGKPMLHAPTHGDVLRFNLSRSAGVALIGTTRDQELGVDLERRRAVPDALPIASRFFSTRETAVLASLAPAEVDAAFLPGVGAQGGVPEGARRRAAVRSRPDRGIARPWRARPPARSRRRPRARAAVVIPRADASPRRVPRRRRRPRSGSAPVHLVSAPAFARPGRPAVGAGRGLARTR
jgi:hypothetical protein